MPLLIIIYLLNIILCCLQEDAKRKKKKKEVFSFQMLVSPRFQLWKGGSVTYFGKDVQDLSKILWDMVASGERSHSVVWQSGGFCLLCVLF